MKLHVIGFVGSVALATAFLAAQEPRSQSPTPSPTDQNRATASSSSSTSKAADVTVTGCLIQGSSPTTFILENAKRSATDKTEKGQSYKLASAGEDLNFQKHLNHEVTITGSSEKSSASASVSTPSASASAQAGGQMAQAGSKADDKDMPTLSAKSLTMVADKCTAPTH
jgi:hypothetical protein